MNNLHDLLIKAKANDDSAFSELFKITVNKMYAYGRVLIKNQMVLDEIVQKAYVDAFTHIDSLQDDNFIPWMKRIVINKCYDYFKTKEFKHNENESDLCINNEDDDLLNYDFEDKSEKYRPKIADSKLLNTKVLFEILDALPDDQRMALHLVYLEEYKQIEAARIMGINVNSLKSKLRYGLSKAKELIVDRENREGVRYHSYAPIPILIALYKQYIDSISIENYAQVGVTSSLANILTVTNNSQLTEKTILENTIENNVTEAVTTTLSNSAKTVNNIVTATSKASTVSKGLGLTSKVCLSLLTVVTGGTVMYEMGVIDPIIEKIDEPSTIVITPNVFTSNTEIIKNDEGSLENIDVQSDESIEEKVEENQEIIITDNPYNPFDNMEKIDVDWVEGHSLHFIRNSNDGKIYADLLVPNETYTQNQIDFVQRKYTFISWFEELLMKYSNDYNFMWGVGGDCQGYAALNDEIFMISRFNMDTFETEYLVEIPEVSSEKNPGELQWVIDTYEAFKELNHRYHSDIFPDELYFPGISLNIVSGQSNGSLKEGDSIEVHCASDHLWESLLNVSVTGNISAIVSDVKEENLVYTGGMCEYGLFKDSWDTLIIG